MKPIELSIGSKLYSLQCEEKDVGMIQELAKQLNTVVNKNSLKYRGLSADNLLLITALELLAKNLKLKEKLEHEPNKDQLSLVETPEASNESTNQAGGEEMSFSGQIKGLETLEEEVDRVCRRVGSLEREIASIQRK